MGEIEKVLGVENQNDLNGKRDEVHAVCEARERLPRGVREESIHCTCEKRRKRNTNYKLYL